MHIKNPGHQFFICHGEPLEPDPIRFDAKGLIGIARKDEKLVSTEMAIRGRR